MSYRKAGKGNESTSYIYKEPYAGIKVGVKKAIDKTAGFWKRSAENTVTREIMRAKRAQRGNRVPPFGFGYAKSKGLTDF